MADRKQGWHDAKGSGGFTLLEILVVLAIIGILMAMMLPAVSKLKDRAKENKASSEARSLAGAIRAYHTEYAQWPGSGTGGVWTSVNTVQVTSNLVAAGNTRRIHFFELTNMTQVVRDPFKSNLPYRIEINMYSNSVKVWSCGADCIDAQGSGDDVSAQY